MEYTNEAAVYHTKATLNNTDITALGVLITRICNNV